MLWKQSVLQLHALFFPNYVLSVTAGHGVEVGRSSVRLTHACNKRNLVFLEIYYHSFQLDLFPDPTPSVAAQTPLLARGRVQEERGEGWDVLARVLSCVN